jgi:hypothetical protein
VAGGFPSPVSNDEWAQDEGNEEDACPQPDVEVDDKIKDCWIVH